MVYDARIILDAVQRYGQACIERDCPTAAALFAEITRMVADDMAKAPHLAEARRGAIVRVA